MGPNYWKFFWNPLGRPSLPRLMGFFSKFENIEINHALIEVGPKMAVKPGFTK